MSIELPEAAIVAVQMKGLVEGKKIASFQLKDTERLQVTGFVNRELHDFDVLAGAVINQVTVRGSTILARLDRASTLLIAPEYGGVILYHAHASERPVRFHLCLVFSDATALTIRLTGMGALQLVPDDGLPSNYMYQRDYLHGADPLDAGSMTEAEFCRTLDGQARMLKAVLVGRDAVFVGIGNAAFEDIAYRSGIHPRRKAAELGTPERCALYQAMRAVLTERIELGGKAGFVDLDGKPGRYRAAVGPGSAGAPCPRCGALFAGVSIGGGTSYFCPHCQPEAPPPAVP